jgi:hypothetical protein
MRTLFARFSDDEYTPCHSVNICQACGYSLCQCDEMTPIQKHILEPVSTLANTCSLREVDAELREILGLEAE